MSPDIEQIWTELADISKDFGEMLGRVILLEGAVAELRQQVLLNAPQSKAAAVATPELQS